MNRASILVAEDEPFIALDLALAVEDAGGRVVGPATNAADALALLRNTKVAGAILDVNLMGSDLSTVAEALIGLGVPIIVQTGGSLPRELAARFPEITVYSKPTAAAVVVAELELLIAERERPTAA